MITTLKQYEDFLTAAYNKAAEEGITEAISLYRYSYLQLKHDVETFPGHNGTVSIPAAFYTVFLDWYDSKGKEDRKLELN